MGGPGRARNAKEPHRGRPGRPNANWLQFLRRQAATMLVVGFFHVDCAVTLRRRYVLFALEVGDHYLHILGVTNHPDGV